MADIFLSYAKVDRVRAEAVVRALSEEGFSVWWDDRIEAAEHWDEGIEREIDAAGAVVVLWSKDSTKSRWVRTEAQFALAAKKLAPAAIDDCTLPIAFLLVQAVDLTRWEGDRRDPNWMKLTARVRDIVRGSVNDEAASAPAFDHSSPDWRAGYGEHVNGEPILRGNTITPQAPAGTVFRDDAHLPLMCVVAAGGFIMGAAHGDPEGKQHERPARNVHIGRPFALGVYAVTFEEWDHAAAQGGVRHRPADERWGRGQRPVINISWNDAQEFVHWLRERTGERYRLPSEAEWEYACRAGASGAYSFAGAIEPRRANYGSQATAPVGWCAPNAFGLYDMHGNVREWVEDLWHDNYAGAPADALAWTTGHSALRVVRGGSWRDEGWFLRSASRGRAAATERCNFIGMRVARDIT